MAEFHKIDDFLEAFMQSNTKAWLRKAKLEPVNNLGGYVFSDIVKGNLWNFEINLLPTFESNKARLEISVFEDNKILCPKLSEKVDMKNGVITAVDSPSELSEDIRKKVNEILSADLLLDTQSGTQH